MRRTIDAAAKNGTSIPPMNPKGRAGGDLKDNKGAADFGQRPQLARVTLSKTANRGKLSVLPGRVRAGGVTPAGYLSEPSPPPIEWRGWRNRGLPDRYDETSPQAGVVSPVISLIHVRS